MPQGTSGHGCHYDADGNVIIEMTEPFVEPSSTDHAPYDALTKPSEDPGLAVQKAEQRERASPFEEGRRQLSATTKDVKDDCLRAAAETRSLYAHIKAAPSFLLSCATAKVTYGRKPSPRSRATLFMLDSIRFGVTFAAIFVGLFVAINYQSFWNIAKAELAFQENLETSHALASLTGGIGNVSADALPAEERPEGSLLSFLPPVGPPENRLVIPKIGKNIPIAIPSMDSLIREDWVQFEKDIQHSLRDGVVHYPGTARPGQAGNFFVTGHSSYYPWDPGKYKDVFARLHELEPGDTYSVYYGGDLHSYRVTEKKEVRPTDVSVLDQPTNTRMATLMTCTPIGTTLRRLVIVAQEIDPVTGKQLKVGEHSVEPILAPKIDSLPI